MKDNAYILYTLQVEDLTVLHRMTNFFDSFTIKETGYAEVIIDMTRINTGFPSLEFKRLCDITGYTKEDFDGASFILFYV